MGAIDRLEQVWGLVMQAPWAFVTIAGTLSATLFGAGLAVARWLYTNRIAELHERLAKRDEQIAELRHIIENGGVEYVAPPLVPADIHKWNHHEYYTINEASFLWAGFVNPTSEKEVGYWIQHNETICEIKSLLIGICEGSFAPLKFEDIHRMKIIIPASEEAKKQGGYLISRRDLQQFAVLWERMRKVPYPAFLEPRPQANDQG